jgi:lipopolysaccharide export system ATP-binding protein
MNPLETTTDSAAPPRSGSLLSTDKLAKAYNQRRVVNGVSIQVNPGEIVGLLGPNGAGKTTTFNIVVGIVKPDEGQVRFQGRDITRLPMHQRARLGIGYLTQEPSVFRKLTVEENILAILETCPMSGKERALRLKSLLDELDLARLATSKAYLLSGGEKRRLEVTRALVTSPKLLLLDEPFSGIDPIAVYEVQKIVRRLKERGLARDLEIGGPGLPDPSWRRHLPGPWRANGQRSKSQGNLSGAGFQPLAGAPNQL